jgi:hypothetical protein
VTISFPPFFFRYAAPRTRSERNKWAVVMSELALICIYFCIVLHFIMNPPFERETRIYCYFVVKKALIWLFRFIISFSVVIFLFYQLLYPLFFSGALAVSPTTSCDLSQEGLPVYEGVPVLSFNQNLTGDFSFFPSLTDSKGYGKA